VAADTATLDEAERTLRRASEVMQSELLADQEAHELRAGVVIALGSVVRRRGRAAEAEEILTSELRKLDTAASPTESATRSLARRELATVLSSSGHVPEARKLLDRSVTELRAAFDRRADPGPVGPEMEHVADAYRALGDEATADQVLKEAEEHRPGRRHRPGRGGPPGFRDRPGPPHKP
jgi:hypothetical protein